MKKLLCSCLCFALLLTCIPMHAQAAAPALSVDCSNTYSAGETFCVNILAENIGNCCTISCQLSYDPSLLEVVQIEQGTAFTGGLFESNPAFLDNAIYLSLTDTTPQMLNGVLATVTFMAKSDAQGAVSFTFLDALAYDINSVPISLSCSTGQAAIIPMPEAQLTIIPMPGEDGTLRLQLSLSDAAFYCGLSFRLSYDTSRYSVVSVTQGEDASGVLFTSNPGISKNEIFVSLASQEAVSLNGHLATVTLQPLAGTADATAFSVQKLKLRDSNGEALPIRWSFSSGTLATLTENAQKVSATAALVNLSTTTQDCTVMLALYAQNGQLLQVSTAKKTLSAGGAAVFDLSVPSVRDGAYVKLFFLNGLWQPLSPAVCQVLSN